MNVLELYSGIGGMHLALKESGVPGKIVAAIEISQIANTVYRHNFSDTLLLNKNIEGLTSTFINKLNVNAIFMSPPCQPFTRNGLRKDELDARNSSFSHLLQIIPELNIRYIFMENVKGFETSSMHNKFLDTLKNCNFTYQEFIISPTQLGISNTRHRYYCLAKRRPLNFVFPTGNLMLTFPNNEKTDTFCISDIIESAEDISNYFLSDTILLKRAKILDICNPFSRRSCCFTKSYGKYVEGTGSVFSPLSKEEIDTIYGELSQLTDENDYVQRARRLKLRFFTPKEVARLMCFPENYFFPENVTKNQKYKLFGNSINVKVCAELIKLLVDK